MTHKALAIMNLPPHAAVFKGAMPDSVWLCLADSKIVSVSKRGLSALFCFCNQKNCVPGAWE